MVIKGTASKFIQESLLDWLVDPKANGKNQLYKNNLGLIVMINDKGIEKLRNSDIRIGTQSLKNAFKNEKNKSCVIKCSLSDLMGIVDIKKEGNTYTVNLKDKVDWLDFMTGDLITDDLVDRF